MNINKSVHTHTHTHTHSMTVTRMGREREREKSCLFVCLCVIHDLAVMVFQLEVDLAHFLDHCVRSPPCACEFHLLISLTSWPVPSLQVSACCDLLLVVVIVLCLACCCARFCCCKNLICFLSVSTHLLAGCFSASSVSFAPSGSVAANPWFSSNGE